MALGECTSLELLVEGKCIALYREEVCEGVAGHIVSECDEVLATTMSSNSGWTANIGVYFITILLGLGTDSNLWYRLLHCTCIETCLAVLPVNLGPVPAQSQAWLPPAFRQPWVQCAPCADAAP